MDQQNTAKYHKSEKINPGVEQSLLDLWQDAQFQRHQNQEFWQNLNLHILSNSCRQGNVGYVTLKASWQASVIFESVHF